jgi:hypothetical protein
MSDRGLHWHHTAFVGGEFWKNVLFSGKMQARSVAKKLLRSNWKDADPDKTPLILHMPLGTYRIIDAKGHVEPAANDAGIRGALLR